MIDDPQPATALDPAPSARSGGIFIGDEGLRAGWGIALFILLFALGLSAQVFVSLKTHAAATQRGSHGPVSLRASFLNETPPLLIVCLVTFILSRVERRPFGVFGLGGARKLPNFLAGLFTGLALLSALVLTLRATHLLAFDTRLLTGLAIFRFGLGWLAGFLLVGLFEEFLLRGYLQFTLARGLSSLYAIVAPRHSRALGFWTSALLLSVVFGLGHRSNPGESPLGLLSAALAGLVFCFALWQTGSLWWAIGLHTSWDWAQSFLYGVADSGTFVQHRLFLTHPVGSPLLSGGLTGPEGSIFILPTLALMALVIALTLGPSRRADPTVPTAA